MPRSDASWRRRGSSPMVSVLAEISRQLALLEREALLIAEALK